MSMFCYQCQKPPEERAARCAACAENRRSCKASGSSDLHLKGISQIVVKGKLDVKKPRRGKL